MQFQLTEFIRFNTKTEDCDGTFSTVSFCFDETVSASISAASIAWIVIKELKLRYLCSDIYAELHQIFQPAVACLVEP